MPINYKNYHPDWKDVIRPSILKRDNYRCRECGAPNRTRIIRQSEKEWLEVDPIIEREAKATGQKIIKIVLTVAHLNHLITDNRDENLKSLCQLHHLRLDSKHKVAMQRVASLWDVPKVLNLAASKGGEIYTPHLLVLARARRNQLAQLMTIQKKRAHYGSYSQYDKDLKILIANTKTEYSLLVEMICKILSESYEHSEPRLFLAEYWSSDLKFIGLKTSIDTELGFEQIDAN